MIYSIQDLTKIVTGKINPLYISIEEAYKQWDYLTDRYSNKGLSPLDISLMLGIGMREYKKLKKKIKP